MAVCPRGCSRRHCRGDEALVTQEDCEDDHDRDEPDVDDVAPPVDVKRLRAPTTSVGLVDVVFMPPILCTSSSRDCSSVTAERSISRTIVKSRIEQGRRSLMARSRALRREHQDRHSLSGLGPDRGDDLRLCVDGRSQRDELNMIHQDAGLGWLIHLAMTILVGSRRRGASRAAGKRRPGCRTLR